MKQILALMTLLLVLLMMITTVMAVGNAKQSEMMTQRAQMISSLRTELRSERQEKEQITGQLETEQGMTRSLRKERDALNRRLSRLMLAVRNQPAGYADTAVDNERSFAEAAPLWSVQASRPQQGEEWLQVQALENTLAKRMVQPMAGIAAEMEKVTAATANAAQTLTTPAETSTAISFAPAAAQSLRTTPTPAPTATPASLSLLAKAAGNALSRMNQFLCWLEETLQQLTDQLLTCCPSAQVAGKPYDP